ncbi:MAG TPA: Na+/H+ antiporter NhaA [Rectinemataceae bacterium]|nr:Na+/H+ antiporter NhaA [Rectinemataceae bacterium]
MRKGSADGSRLFGDFFESERNSALVLLSCVLFALVLANSSLGLRIFSLLHQDAGLSFGFINIDFSIEKWINDGLMTVFFLLVGLEIERELYVGELSNIRAAALPIVSAIGGMLVPASIYMVFNLGTPSQNGIGIPMATDIAFALGAISLLGNRISLNLKIFLTAFAIIDDIGSIIFLAFFYSHSITLGYVVISLSVIALLVVLNRTRVKSLIVYLGLGVVLWYCLAKAGIHPTMTGIIIAFAIPYSKASYNPSFKLQNSLNVPVAFLILPIFAFANTGIVLDAGVLRNLSSPYAAGILFGLVVGKPLGIFLFTLLGVKLLGLRLPAKASWGQIFGIGCLGGIGFTMSIFMTNLAFSDVEIVKNAKIYILFASVISGLIGYAILRGGSAKSRMDGESKEDVVEAV